MRVNMWPAVCQGPQDRGMRDHISSHSAPRMQQGKTRKAPVLKSHLALEDMAQVASALGAGDLHTLHAIGVVLMPVHSSCSSQAWDVNHT